MGRYWNGTFGRMARRDIWLTAGADGWYVRAREGGEDGKEIPERTFADEEQARNFVRRLMVSSPGQVDNWKDITEAVQRQEDRRRWPSGPYTPPE